MNWAYALLELAPDADERTVKRAYAKRLRITRPDDDPEAFQQLHEAYKSALEWAQYRVQWEEEEAAQHDPTQSQAPLADAADEPDARFASANLMPGTEFSSSESTAFGELHDPVQLTGSNFPALREVSTEADPGPHVLTVAPATTDNPSANPQLPVIPAVAAFSELRDPVQLTGSDTQTLPEISTHAEPAPGPSAGTPATGVDSTVAGVQMPDLPIIAPLLDTDAMIQLILGQAFLTEAGRFEAWLQNRPELWSLLEKPRVGVLLAMHLFNHDAPIRNESFDVLIRFFRWDEVDNGVDPVRIQQCRQRLHRNWMLQPAGASDLARHLRGYGRHVTAADAKRELQRLTRPWQPWQALWSAVPPWRTVQVNRLLERLGVAGDGNVPAPLQPAQVAFWSSLSDYSKPAGPRMQLALLQGLLLGVGFLLLVLLGWALLGLRAPADSNMARLPGALRAGAYGGGILLAARALIPCWLEMMRWISADEHPRPGYAVLHRWLIPILGVSSVLLIHLAHARLAGSVLAWLTLMLAAWRHWRRGRHVYRWKMPLTIWFLAIVLMGGITVKLLMFLLAFGELVAGLALVFWLRDSWLRLWRRGSRNNATAMH